MMDQPVLTKDGVRYLWSKIAGKLSDKVTKEEGKTLTSNDFTDELKAKLDKLKETISYNDLTDRPNISGVYRYKGSVATVSDLPTEGNEVGDVWDVSATNMNYGWTGTAWDPMGSVFELTPITNAEIDSITEG